MGAVKQVMLDELWKEQEDRERTETREALEEAREEEREEDRMIEESIQDQLESQKPIAGGVSDLSDLLLAKNLDLVQ